MAKNIIALIGDSTLDNGHWALSSVPQQLQARLPDDTIKNFAVDGFTTQDVLDGALRNKAVTDKEHKSELYSPLKQLRDAPDVTHVVLSVGGNDFREKMGRIILGAANIEDVIQQLQDNYLRILENILAINPFFNLMMMTQYPPDVYHDRYGLYLLMERLNPSQDPALTLQGLFKTLYAPIIKKAKELKIPIIDATSSFDHKNSSLYTTQIEPSDKGGKVIVDLIEVIVRDHDFDNDSLFYSTSYAPGHAMVEKRTHEEQTQIENNFSLNHPELTGKFWVKYEDTWSRDKQSWCGLFSLFARSNVRRAMSLEDLVQHAQGLSGHGTGKRSQKIMKELGWINEDNELSGELFRCRMAP